ncbi:MAG TPA: amidohydrolase [Candidatus Limnocylindrales bacterium]|nr:amidohydrolase [Candidatus Limnocylindrales bacterium]
MPTALKEAVERRVKDLVGRRRHFHAEPELSFQERETARVIADHLGQWGFEVQTGVASTGVVGSLRGGRPGKGVLVRADMDGLPLEERSELPFRSIHRGVMQACGHDVHMAIALTLAELLAERRAELPGLVRFAFQPAEEVAGGAKPMVEAGVLDGIDRVIGLHVWAGLATGLICARPGPLMASADQFSLTITGKGGHGALPHLTVDAVVIAAQVITALQTLRSRETPPAAPIVVTLGSIHGGTAHNIIAGEVVIEGTLRTFDSTLRQRLLGRIQELAQAIASGMGGAATFRHLSGTPPVVNDAAMAGLVAEAAEVVGAENVVSFEPLMVGEDFAYFLEQRPGCFFLLGGAPPGGPRVHHTADFAVDEACLPIGLEVLGESVLRMLSD